MLNFLAMVGMTINDIIAMFSVFGSFMLLVGAVLNSRRNPFTQFADWSILGLIFGGVSQIAMALTGSTPDKIGILLPMSAAAVDGLLFLSLLLLLAQWWIKKNKWRLS